MRTSNRPRRRANSRPVNRPVFENLEYRLLLSTAVAVPPPPVHTGARADEVEYYKAHSDDSAGYVESGDEQQGTAVVCPPDGMMTQSHFHDGSDGGSREGVPLPGYDNGGHGWHDQQYVSGDGTVIVFVDSKDGEYYHQQGGSVSYSVQPAYITLPMTMVVMPGIDHPQDRPAPAAATPVPVAKPAVPAVAATAAPKSNVSMDVSTIETSAPQHANPASLQPFALTPVNVTLNASRPHTHVENTLLVDTWKLGTASFSQTPIVSGLDWEVTAATNAVSSGASVDFVASLITSDAAALARVANTVAYRLYEENALLWKETAAFIGAAMLVGGYVTRNRTAQTHAQNEVRAAYRCIGEPE
jgi:hypothetical protein